MRQACGSFGVSRAPAGDRIMAAIRTPKEWWSTIGDWEANAESVATPVCNAVMEKLLGVYESIEARLPATASRLIAFIGTTPTDGTSTLASAYANLLSTDLGKRVLLLRARASFRESNVRLLHACEDVVHGRVALPDILHQVEKTQLYLGHVCADERSISTLVMKPAFHGVTQELRNSFDYVIVDASTCSSSAEAVSLCAHADGAILVVESEKTRWHVADHLRADIAMRGGVVLGVVLNKVQRHLPNAIYRRL